MESTAKAMCSSSSIARRAQQPTNQAPPPRTITKQNSEADGPTLYRMDPSSGVLTTIGDFDLGSGFNDLAFHVGPLPCE
jgi:hypothetical protein